MVVRKKGVSVRDLARECEVSVGTISRVINNKPGIREDLRQRVLEAIRRHHYNPYINVPLVHKIRTRSIRVVAPLHATEGFKNPLFALGLDALYRTAFEYGYDIMLTDEAHMMHSFSIHEKSKIPNTTEGVLFFSPQHPCDKKIAMVKKWGVPIALINGETTHKEVLVVQEKERTRVFDALVTHLVSLGHRRFGYIDAWYPASVKNDTFVAAALRAHTIPLMPAYHLSPKNNLEQQLYTFVRHQNLPDVFICGDDTSALYALKYLQKQGCRIPEDVALVGYANTEGCLQATPTLTSIETHIAEMVSGATRWLIERIEDIPISGIPTGVAADICIRESCGSVA